MNDNGERDVDEREAGEEVERRLKVRAFDLILDAWEAARAEGVEPETLATAAIYAALTEMVDIYGEEPIANMAETLPQRIRAGEFSLDDDDDAE